MLGRSPTAACNRPDYVLFEKWQNNTHGQKISSNIVHYVCVMEWGLASNGAISSLLRTYAELEQP